MLILRWLRHMPMGYVVATWRVIDHWVWWLRTGRDLRPLGFVTWTKIVFWSCVMYRRAKVYRGRGS